MSAPTPPRRRRIAGERRRAEELPETVEAQAPADLAGPAPATDPPPAVEAAATHEVEEVPVDAEPEVPETPAKPASRLLFALTGLVTVVLVTVAFVLGLGVWDYREVREADTTAASGRAAAAAAERAATAALAYNHETLDADLRSATSFMTPEFAETFSDTFETFVRPNAPEQNAVVTAEVLASAVVNAGETRAEILVYVDQTTLSKANAGQPSVALNRTTFDMVKTGDGSWLVDNFASY